MKKIAAIALVLVLILTMAACGRRRNNAAETTRDTMPITVPTMPDMTMPSSNIPDPTVDSNSTMPTDGTNTTDTTGVAANR